MLSKGCKDLDSLKTHLKEKIRGALNSREKIKFRILAPDSSSQEKTAEEFGVSIYFVKCARKLKKDNGILADVPPKKNRTLSENIVQRVIAHYHDNEFTRMCPGRKTMLL